MVRNPPAPLRDEVEAALAELSAITGVQIEWSGTEPAKSATRLVVAGCEITLPRLVGEKRELFGISGFWPTVPRADDRDKLLWRIYQEASAEKTPDKERPPLLDSNLETILRQELPLPAGEARDTVADAVIDRFYSRKKARVLLPLQSVLPANYAHSTQTGKAARYRMFSGELLPFLLWDHEKLDFDMELMNRLLELVDGDADLTRIDELFLDVAKANAPHLDWLPQSDRLIDLYRKSITEDMSVAGPFCPPALTSFRRDLDTVLSTDLPRPDKISWLTLLFSLHVALWMYRGALVKWMQLDSIIAAAANVPGPSSVGCDAHVDGCSPELLRNCPMAAALRFRTRTGRYEAIRLRDKARSTYSEMDQSRLQALPATLITLNLATAAWNSLMHRGIAERPDLSNLVADLKSDSEFRRNFNAACAAIAIVHHAAHRGPAALRHELSEVARVSPLRPGIFLLRDDILRLRRKDLRHQSRDIVNQLVFVDNTGPGSMISRNGTIGYFELDERLLQLLVRLVCRNDAVPVAEFLRALTEYGLAPQSQEEQERFVAALERLGLLVRYSDAGEAAYVHFPN